MVEIEVCEDSPKERGPDLKAARRIDATGKDSWRPKPGHHSGALRSDGSRVGREDKMGGGRRFRNRGGKHRGYYKENANHGRFRQTPGKSHADYGPSAAWYKHRAAQRR